MDEDDFEERIKLYRLRYRVNGIIRDSNREMNQIKRSGAKLRLWTIPPISVLLALLAWYNWTHGTVSIGIVNAAGSLAFLAMLVLGAIIDRPLPEDRDTRLK